jgi:hypothetical protein
VNLDEILAAASPRTLEVQVCLNAGLVTAHEEAVRELQRALDRDDSLAGDPAVTAAAEAVQAVEQQLDAATHTFRLRAVSRKVWADLLAKYPPTAEHRRAGHDADPDRFPVAAVAACLVEPELSEADVAKLAASDAMTFGEWQKLWLAALQLNLPPTPHPKLEAATELLRANGRSSTTSVPEASLDLGSLAGGDKQ